MAISYKSNTTNYRVRSVSLPTTSHPSVQKLEIELNDIKTCLLSSSCKPSTEAVCDGLMKLSRFYDHEVINLLSLIHNEKWVEELMDRLVGFLDICGILKDTMSQIKDHVRDLECAFRARKGDSCIKSSVTRYKSFRKKIKKDVKRLIVSLKQSMVEGLVIKMIIEMTISVFESLLMLFVTPKTNKWCMMASKLTQRKRVACEEQNFRQTNDFEGLDIVLQNRIKKEGFSSWLYASCRWETMEDEIQRFEDSLECIFRSLIRTRAHLLNIVFNN